ncbi:TMEM175 family protein [Lysinibacter cavernae]|uniref:Putative membrane protein n=1 Tax=Lysinibacter cavernae TaxID=1640652 RepID=A0A7X5R3G8_9MICO|nr:TMEM175 family protein [Lysinibacter cavernae]NIH54958.1 putative membrane protein [Lysinibacter cavernae]
MSARYRHTERGLDRLVNFSDAVVAIAITLLVLPLVELAKEASTTDPLTIIENSGYSLLAFAISFVVIGRFWLVHHAFYEGVTGYNTPLLWSNMLWLLSIVFLPFPTALLAEAGTNSPVTNGLYIGTMTITTVAMLLQRASLMRHPELLPSGPDDQHSALQLMLTTATFAVAGVISVLVPDIGVAALFLLLFTGVFRRLIEGKRHHQADPQSPPSQVD